VAGPWIAPQEARLGLRLGRTRRDSFPNLRKCLLPDIPAEVGEPERFLPFVSVCELILYSLTLTNIEPHCTPCHELGEVPIKGMNLLSSQLKEAECEAVSQHRANYTTVASLLGFNSVQTPS
jgi:hypothetical protein